MNIRETLIELNKIMSDAQVGRAVGAPQSIITRLRNGVTKQTSYDRGEAIKNLARQNNIYW